MSSALITGANRGLGLAFIRQYLDRGWTVHACCREPDRADALQELNAKRGLKIHRLDVTAAGEVQALARKLGGDPIDVLISNAGIYGPRLSLGSLDYEAWLKVLEVNTIAPIRLAEAFADHVARSKRKIMVGITSKMGSIADNSSGGSYLYRSSKAALNAAYKSLAVDLAPRSVICVVIHPGWVRTDMGGPNGLIDADTSVSGMRRVIEGLGPEDSGRFFNYDGAAIPW